MNKLKSILIDIGFILIGIILTIVLGSLDTEMHEMCGKGMTYFFYLVFSANVMLIPSLAYHHHND